MVVDARLTDYIALAARLAIRRQGDELAKLRVELEIATKLYAKARKITVEEAGENIRDARLNRNER